MASSMSGQDEPNSVLWLATWAGKMELGTTRHVTKNQIINPLLTKLFRSSWLDIGFVLFVRVYGPQLHLNP